MEKVERKNYSLYMPSDFGEKLDKIQENRPSIKSLSKSQAVYYIISEMCENMVSVDKNPDNNEQ